MPALTYSVSDFTPFTKIRSADVNTRFQDIKTLLNTTKLDDDNIQALGISLSKLKQSSATAGQFPAWNGSAWVAAANPIQAQFNVIFGSAAQVTAGTATHSAFSAWTQASGDRVLILPAYSESASWTLTQKVSIQGLGNTSQITGSLTLASGSSKSSVRNCRITTGVTVNSGVDGCLVQDVWFPTSITFTDNATALANYLSAMQET